MNRRLSSGEGREDPTAAAAARKQRKCCPPPPPSLPALSLPVFTLFLSHCFPAFRCPLKWPCHWPTPGIGRKLEVRPGKHLLAMLLLIALLPATCQGTHHRHEHGKCTVDGTICSTSKAQICRNNTCVSVCSLRGMKECRCDSEEDNYCFLCCGSGQDRCLPAHDHGILRWCGQGCGRRENGIFRDNGERWERESCSRCRMNGAEMEGLACDDTDPQRLCLQGKCSKSVCADKQQGQYCDRKMEKICVDDMCENPCAKISSHLMVCECPSIDPDTGFASEDRCQLCCYDFNQKPASRRCRNAFRNYDLRSTQERPIWRIGLECAGGKRCNRYGICSNDAEPSGNGNHRMPLIFLAILLFVLVAAALVTTSETF